MAKRDPARATEVGRLFWYSPDPFLGHGAPSLSPGRDSAGEGNAKGDDMAILAILIGGLAVTTASTVSLQPPTPARLVSGSISNADYPASAIRAEARGTTTVTLAIGTDGRVSGCTVTATSGNAALDSTTCALSVRRFRFRPATLNGRPVVSTVSRSVRWTPPSD
jgi:TonB family protein